ncbi:hypothetical protein HDU85_007367 [Gaertneriomyces sp. JEL0708]|nr:hypothetical protein HDU85_007367 [Gaertneriomyces sp. JEL0708]
MSAGVKTKPKHIYNAHDYKQWNVPHLLSCIKLAGGFSLVVEFEIGTICARTLTNLEITYFKTSETFEAAQRQLLQLSKSKCTLHNAKARANKLLRTLSANVSSKDALDFYRTVAKERSLGNGKRSYDVALEDKVVQDKVAALETIGKKRRKVETSPAMVLVSQVPVDEQDNTSEPHPECTGAVARRCNAN